MYKLYLSDRISFSILTQGQSLPMDKYTLKPVKTKNKSTLQVMKEIKSLQWGDA